jgi:hypothetical protein
MSLSLKTEKKPDAKTKVAELREYHQSTFDALGIPDAYYYPKLAYRPKGKDELHISLFPSELRKGTDIYTEFVSTDYVLQDSERTLWKLHFNPHWEEEYDTTDAAESMVRYLIPVSELVKVKAPAKPTRSGAIVTEFEDFSNLLDDCPITEMTVRDFAAIMLKKPVSSKSWLNDLVK